MPEARYAVIVESAEALAASVPIEEGRVRAHRLAEAPGATVVCLALDADTVLSRHIAAGPILIQTVTGEVVVEVAGEKVGLPVGGLLHVAARVQHEVRAVARARVLVTLMPDSETAAPGSRASQVPGIIRKKMIPLDDVSGAGGPSSSGAHDHECTCGATDESLPELDARSIPHAIRHATIFGALDGLRPRESFVLIAPHDPLPLLAQIEHRYEGAVDVAYGQRGPDEWRLRLTRAR